MTAPHESLLAWSIIVPATAGVIVRSFRVPEAIWAAVGAAALVLLGLLPLADALNGMRKGLDVYLFLIGMMLTAELALVAGSVAASDHLPAQVVNAMLIGVDLGPNLSVTGSLATILWLVALRREKIEVTAWRFLCIGLLVTPPALITAAVR